MTDKQITRFVHDWRIRLGLDSWDITLKLQSANDVSDDEHILARIRYEFNTLRGWLILLRDNQADDAIRSALLHELLHLHHAEMRVLHTALLELVGTETRAVFEKLMIDAEERAVLRLERVLAPMIERERSALSGSSKEHS